MQLLIQHGANVRYVLPNGRSVLDLYRGSAAEPIIRTELARLDKTIPGRIRSLLLKDGQHER